MASLLLPILALISLALAQDLPSVMNGSVFVYQGKEQEFGPPGHGRDSDPSITFALNAESSTGDLYFHLESPKDNQWVGVGIGSQMKDALFLIAYASGNGSGVTISGRTASGHTEPSAIEGLVIDKVYDEGLTNANTVTRRDSDDDEEDDEDDDDDKEGSIIVDAVCRKCANYGNGVASIDFQSKEQQFIFAIGPPLYLESDSLNAGLQEHILYGHFTMDMTVATSDSAASIPLGPYTMSETTILGGVSQDHDPASRIHGIVMSIVFIIILPLGALFVRVWNVRAHIVVQLIGWILFCMAFAGGAVVSRKYNKSRNFASGHQVLGILILIALLGQWVLGWMNHRTFKKMGRGTVMGKIHSYLGPITIFIGLINGALGFRFASERYLAVPYAILIIIFAILFFALRILILRRRATRAKAGMAPPGMPAFDSQGPALAHQQQGYYHSSAREEPDDAPPAYGSVAGGGGGGGAGIHLQQYPSTQSLPQAQGALVQPRGML